MVRQDSFLDLRRMVQWSAIPGPWPCQRGSLIRLQARREDCDASVPSEHSHGLLRIQDHALQLGPGCAQSTEPAFPQIRPGKPGAREHAVRQVTASEHGPGKLAVDEARFDQLAFLEARALELTPFELEVASSAFLEGHLAAPASQHAEAGDAATLECDLAQRGEIPFGVGEIAVDEPSMLEIQHPERTVERGALDIEIQVGLPTLKLHRSSLRALLALLALPGRFQAASTRRRRDGGTSGERCPVKGQVEANGEQQGAEAEDGGGG